MSDKEAVNALMAHRVRFADDFGWDKNTIEALDFAIASLINVPVVPHEMSVAEESRLRVSWRWLEDFACEYKSGQYAEFILAAKRAYISSIEKMYEPWMREHPKERSKEDA